ncbi:unnamed protein product, partial [Urochloa humidicola]
AGDKGAGARCLDLDVDSQLLLTTELAGEGLVFAHDLSPLNKAKLLISRLEFQNEEGAPP